MVALGFQYLVSSCVAAAFGSFARGRSQVMTTQSQQHFGHSAMGLVVHIRTKMLCSCPPDHKPTTRVFLLLTVYVAHKLGGEGAGERGGGAAAACCPTTGAAAVVLPYVLLHDHPGANFIVIMPL
jgi:hypothetical protein